MSKTVRVDCKGETTVAQNIRETMQSFLKRNYAGNPKVPHTSVKVTSQNCVEFPEEPAYLKAFEESKKRLRLKFVPTII